MGDEGQQAEPPVNGAAQHLAAEEDDSERPMKKFRAEDGAAVPRAAHDLDEEDVNGEPDADDLDEEAAEDEVPDDEVEDVEDEEVLDETMDNPGEEPEERGELRDEALDEPDSE